MTRSISKRVGMAALIMMASVLLSRVIGLLREVVIAWAGGATGDVDAYQVAFILPEILNHIAASGFLSITFIPIFSEYLAKGKEDDGWVVFSILCCIFGSVLALLIAVAMVFAPGLVALVAPGLQDPATVAQAVRMTRIILPAQFFFFFGGLLMAVQFARESFAVPALAPLIYNLGIIGCGVVLGPRLGMAGFSWGVLAGAFVGNFLLQIYGARRVGMKFQMLFRWRHPDVRRYLRLTLPLMVGLTMTFSTEFFLKFFGSYLPAGSIASLNYGFRVMFILVGLFGQALGVASYPYMARLAVENRLDEMNRLLNTTLRYLMIVVPFSILLAVLRTEIVVLLFQRGRFDPAATMLTARVLQFLMIGTVAFAAQTVVVRGYYATQDTLFPAIYGTAAVLLSLPIYLAGLHFWGISGVALAISLSAIFQAWLLFAMWNRKNGNAGGRSVYGAAGKMLLIGVLAGGIAYGIKQLMFSGWNPLLWQHSLATAAVVSVLFVAVLAILGRLLKIEEIEAVLRRVGGKTGLKSSP